MMENANDSNKGNDQNNQDEKNFSAVRIILTIIFISLGISMVILMLQDEIYALVNGSNIVATEAEVGYTDNEDNADDNADNAEVETETKTEAEVAVVAIVQPVTEPAEPPTEPTESLKSEPDVEENTTEQVTEPENSEEATTEAEAPTEAPTEAPPQNGVIGFTEVDYPTQMFEKALKLEILDDDADKKIKRSVVVEPPPLGRDLNLHAKITPVNQNIPNPSEYFENIIFLGDSVTTGFDLYRNFIKFNGELVLERTTVIAVKSYGIFNATRSVSEKSVHPLVDGVQTLPEDIIAEKSGSKVFICLGLNDISWQSSDVFFQNYADLINRIRAKSPKKTVVIMPVTPLTLGGQKENMTNERIMQFNDLLIEFAAYNNIPFVDYAAALRDENNNLYSELSSDNYCHIISGAYDRLVEYILYHSID